MAFEVVVKSWVTHKVSSFRRRRSRDKQALEATKLKPIALAGASNGFSGRSQLCSSFARTQTRILRFEANIEVVKAAGDPQIDLKWLWLERHRAITPRCKAPRQRLGPVEALRHVLALRSPARQQAVRRVLLARLQNCRVLGRQSRKLRGIIASRMRGCNIAKSAYIFKRVQSRYSTIASTQAWTFL